jgi:hypothetical protein
MKLFQRVVAFVSIVIALSAGIGHAADEPADTCVLWRQMEGLHKQYFLIGWIKSMEMAKAVAEAFVDEPVVIEIRGALDVSLWPKGHRLGSLVVEMDVECGKPENRNQGLGHSMVNIALRLNKRR